MLPEFCVSAHPQFCQAKTRWLLRVTTGVSTKYPTQRELLQLKADDNPAHENNRGALWAVPDGVVFVLAEQTPEAPGL